jgi:glycosyltransferase involved in cell wall biosynthesis
MLSHEFSYSMAIFVEGGSIDDTPAILEAWARSSPSNNRTIITIKGNDSFEESGHFKGYKLPREGRLSNARNVGLTELFRLEKLGVKTEFVIVVDLDVLGWDPYGVADSFQKVSNWDVVCANGILLHGVYRDTYAFRTETLNTNHHWAGNDEVMYNISAEEKKDHRRDLKVTI